MTTRERTRDWDRPLRGYRRRGEDAAFVFLRALAISLIVLGVWTMWLAATRMG